MVRQILLMSVVLAGAGCQCLGGRDCRTTEGDEGCHPRHFAGLPRRAPVCDKPCEETKKPVSKPPEMPKAAPAPEDITRAVVAQDVLLVPKTVYVPYVAQSPVAPVRLAGMSAPPPPFSGPSDVPSGRGAPPCDTSELRQMLDICKKLNDRIDRMEKCVGERQSLPPTFAPLPPAPEPMAAPPCPTPAPPCPAPGFLPLLRRPVFQHCEPLYTCPPAQQPAPAPSETLPTAPKKLGSS